MIKHQSPTETEGKRATAKKLDEASLEGYSKDIADGKFDSMSAYELATVIKNLIESKLAQVQVEDESAVAELKASLDEMVKCCKEQGSSGYTYLIQMLQAMRIGAPVLVAGLGAGLVWLLAPEMSHPLAASPPGWVSTILNTLTRLSSGLLVLTVASFLVCLSMVPQVCLEMDSKKIAEAIKLLPEAERKEVLDKFVAAKRVGTVDEQRFVASSKKSVEALFAVPDKQAEKMR